ncbi:MAG TPA: hypothetical protein VM098_02730 [Phycisphaerae bacterium]|nr:hypothetical protein [Phycisphaerae bacterium]
MLKKCILLSLCCLVFAAVGLAKQQTIKLKNGNKITGEITRTSDGYKVRLPSGLETVIKADEVAEIVDVVSAEEEYEKQKAQVKVDPQNPSRTHYVLANWACQKGALERGNLEKAYLEIAQKELHEALRLKPEYEAAQLLLKRVEKKLRPPEQVGRIDDTKAVVTPVKAVDTLLDKVDINRIRLAELREGDDVPIAFQGNVVEKFIQDYRSKGPLAEPDGETKFRQLSNIQKAIYILDNIDRDDFATKDKIVVRNDPKFMVEFRKNVWPIIARNCGRSDCHGGDKAAGGFKLLPVRGSRESTEYTNFYILDSFRKADLYLIDRSIPEKSLLLQFGLPEKLADDDHPKAITAIFADNSDSKYVQLRDWIQSLRAVHHGYGLRYKGATGAQQAPKEEEPSEPAPGVRREPGREAEQPRW